MELSKRRLILNQISTIKTDLLIQKNVHFLIYPTEKSQMEYFCKKLLNKKRYLKKFVKR